MKFVIGLLAGALGTLAIATLTGLDWEPPSRLAKGLLVPAQMSERMSERMDEQVDEQVGVAASIALTDAPMRQTDSAASDNSAPFRSVTIDPLSPEPVSAPAPAPTAPAAVAAPEPEPEPEPESAQIAQSAIDERSAGQPQSFAAEPFAVDPLTEQSDALADATTAVVWKPFHSEVSATGFARRLSVQLGYPFRALREGPAKYHVVFDYESDQQRELLRQQVQALTGFSLI